MACNYPWIIALVHNWILCLIQFFHERWMSLCLWQNKVFATRSEWTQTKVAKSTATFWSCRAKWDGERGKELPWRSWVLLLQERWWEKRLGNRMKNDGVVFIHLSMSLVASDLCYFHPVAPTAPAVHWCPPRLLPPQSQVKALCSLQAEDRAVLPLHCQLKRKAQHKSRESCFIWWANLRP